MHDSRFRVSVVAGFAALVVSALPVVDAQQPPGPPASARTSAPADFTGTFVSVVTEDWRWRMVTPARGDFASIPLTEKALAEGQAWDPARDERAGDACKAYGAAGLMRAPGRIRITWQDDNTLKVETEAGTQTRLLRFASTTGARGTAVAPNGPASWQGTSVASWETVSDAPRAARTGTLKVVTTRMRPGYLRKNGVPYSANAVLTEYWDLNAGPDGTPWLVITTVVDDPEYLAKPWVTSPNFKKQPNDAGWMPTACSTTW